MGPWNTDQINRARGVRFSTVLDYLGAHHKTDPEYASLDPTRKSVRVQVGYRGRDFRFIITGEKWVNELLSEGTLNRGGGGAIDFVRHISGLGFVQAVKICLDAGDAAAVSIDAVGNDGACLGVNCDRKGKCLRHLILSGNVPCFPLANSLCYLGDDKVFRDYFVLVPKHL